MRNSAREAAGRWPACVARTKGKHNSQLCGGVFRRRSERMLLRGRALPDRLPQGSRAAALAHPPAPLACPLPSPAFPCLRSPSAPLRSLSLCRWSHFALCSTHPAQVLRTQNGFGQDREDMPEVSRGAPKHLAESRLVWRNRTATQQIQALCSQIRPHFWATAWNSPIFPIRLV